MPRPKILKHLAGEKFHQYSQEVRLIHSRMRFACWNEEGSEVATALAQLESTAEALHQLAIGRNRQESERVEAERQPLFAARSARVGEEAAVPKKQIEPVRVRAAALGIKERFEERHLLGPKVSNQPREVIPVQIPGYVDRLWVMTVESFVTGGAVEQHFVEVVDPIDWKGPTRNEPDWKEINGGPYEGEVVYCDDRLMVMCGPYESLIIGYPPPSREEIEQSETKAPAFSETEAEKIARIEEINAGFRAAGQDLGPAFERKAQAEAAAAALAEEKRQAETKESPYDREGYISGGEYSVNELGMEHRDTKDSIAGVEWKKIRKPPAAKLVEIKGKRYAVTGGVYQYGVCLDVWFVPAVPENDWHGPTTDRDSINSEIGYFGKRVTCKKQIYVLGHKCDRLIVRMADQETAKAEWEREQKRTREIAESSKAGREDAEIGQVTEVSEADQEKDSSFPAWDIVVSWETDTNKRFRLCDARIWTADSTEALRIWSVLNSADAAFKPQRYKAEKASRKFDEILTRYGGEQIRGFEEGTVRIATNFDRPPIKYFFDHQKPTEAKGQDIEPIEPEVIEEPAVQLKTQRYRVDLPLIDGQPSDLGDTLGTVEATTLAGAIQEAKKEFEGFYDESLELVVRLEVDCPFENNEGEQVFLALNDKGESLYKVWAMTEAEAREQIADVDAKRPPAIAEAMKVETLKVLTGRELANLPRFVRNLEVKTRQKVSLKQAMQGQALLEDKPENGAGYWVAYSKFNEKEPIYSLTASSGGEAIARVKDHCGRLWPGRILRVTEEQFHQLPESCEQLIDDALLKKEKLADASLKEVASA